MNQKPLGFVGRLYGAVYLLVKGKLPPNLYSTFYTARQDGEGAAAKENPRPASQTGLGDAPSDNLESGSSESDSSESDTSKEPEIVENDIDQETGAFPYAR